MIIKEKLDKFKDSIEDTAYAVEMDRYYESKGKRPRVLNYAEAVTIEVWYRWIAPAICKLRGHALIETGSCSPTSGWTEVECIRCGEQLAGGYLF